MWLGTYFTAHLNVRGQFVELGLSLHIYMGSEDQTHATKLTRQVSLPSMEPHHWRLSYFYSLLLYCLGGGM